MVVRYPTGVRIVCRARGRAHGAHRRHGQLPRRRLRAAGVVLGRGNSTDRPVPQAVAVLAAGVVEHRTAAQSRPPRRRAKRQGSQSRRATAKRPSSSVTITPSPLPNGGTSCPVRPSTAASLVGLWPTHRRRPSPGSCAKTPRSAAPRTTVSLSTSSGSSCAHRLEVSATAGLARLAPAVLDDGAEAGFHAHRHLLLPGRGAQCGHHLVSAGGSGGDEQCVRRVQTGTADPFRRGQPLFGELIAVVVGVSTNLDVLHDLTLSVAREAVEPPSSRAGGSYAAPRRPSDRPREADDGGRPQLRRAG